MDDALFHLLLPAHPPTDPALAADGPDSDGLPAGGRAWSSAVHGEGGGQAQSGQGRKESSGEAGLFPTPLAGGDKAESL